MIGFNIWVSETQNQSVRPLKRNLFCIEIIHEIGQAAFLF